MSIKTTAQVGELSGLSKDKIELLKKTVCKNATDDELQLFIHVCKRTGLDPFMKQIYAVKRGGKDGTTMTIQTSIDGLRLIADRSGNYAPGREPSFTYDEDKRLVSATSYLKKRTSDGTWHEVSATAFYTEYKPKFNNNFWDGMPHIMLAKCAEALALRKAFPAEMSAIYTEDEMQQAKPEYLSEEQQDEIVNTIGENVELVSRIMKWYNVKSLAEIESRHFNQIMNSAQKKKEIA